MHDTCVLYVCVWMHETKMNVSYWCLIRSANVTRHNNGGLSSVGELSAIVVEMIVYNRGMMLTPRSLSLSLLLSLSLSLSLSRSLCKYLYIYYTISLSLSIHICIYTYRERERDVDDVFWATVDGTDDVFYKNCMNAVNIYCVERLRDHGPRVLCWERNSVFICGVYWQFN